MRKKVFSKPRHVHVQKIIFFLLAVVVVITGCSSGSDSPVLFRKSTVETNRDAQGVWFVTGSSEDSLYDVFEAVGYAVATDRLWQAETFRRTGRGKLA